MATMIRSHVLFSERPDEIHVSIPASSSRPRHSPEPKQESQCLASRPHQHSKHTTSHQGQQRWMTKLSQQRHFHRPTHSNLLILLVIMISCSFTTATPYTSPDHLKYPLSPPTEEQPSSPSFDPSEPLLVDLTPPPWNYNEVLIGPDDPFLDEDSYLGKRQDLFGDASTSIKHSTSSTAKPTPTANTTPTSTVKSQSSTVASSTPAPTGGILTTGTPDANSPLPSPFDSSLGNNFTASSCPEFIKNFLADAQFKACLPFSLLLQNSNSFFQAEKSIVRITQVLDATCAAPSTTCNKYLSSLALNLTSTTACAADYKAQNPTVLQAYTGLLAYQPLYAASCLKNPSTNSYCFADAITNSSSYTDSYVYFLPLNMTLPASAEPTCNQCLKNTMGVFNAAAANRTLAIANTYEGAAGQINVQCGPSFVAASNPAPLTSAASSGLGSHVLLGHGGFVALFMVALAWLL